VSFVQSVNKETIGIKNSSKYHFLKVILVLTNIKLVKNIETGIKQPPI